MNKQPEKEAVKDESVDQQSGNHKAPRAYIVPNRHDRRKAEAIRRRAEKIDKKKTDETK